MKLNQGYLVKHISKILKHIFLILGVIIVLYPFVWLISSSLKTNNEYFTSVLKLIPENFQWQNYVRAWKVGHFSRYLINSLIISGSVSIIILLLSSHVGYILGRYKFPGRSLIYGVVISAMFLPTTNNIIPLYQIVRSMGLLNKLSGVIVALSATTPTLFILLFAVFFSGLPRELGESAELDGAGFYTIFFRIYLPLAKPVIASVMILRFMWSWNDFMIPLIFTLGRPELRTVSVGMYSFVGEHFVDYTGMAAAAVMSLLPSILVFLSLQKYYMEATAGSIKF